MTARQTHQNAPGQAQMAVVGLQVGRQPYLSARMRLLGRLQEGPVWTLDLRREPHRWSANPAQRVAELREKHDIRTIRAWRYGEDGRPVWFRDYYVLILGSKWNGQHFRFEGGKPVLGTMYGGWRDAIRVGWRKML